MTADAKLSPKAAASLLPTEGPLIPEELQLATRNGGMPLEALRYDITPVGLHYQLIHFDIPDVDPATWRLRVDGLVERPLDLSYDEIRALPAEKLTVTLECAGNGRARLFPRPLSMPWLNEAIGTARWRGVPLHRVLDRAGVSRKAVDVVFTGADHGIEKGCEQDYARSVQLDDALRPEVLLAFEMNDQPLLPQHGFPLRLLIPGWYGMMHVKWLTRIEVLAQPFDGYQQQVAYWYKKDANDRGEPVKRMRIRALMVPPGFPDYFTRHRYVEHGLVTLRGRAWAGKSSVARVEVGIDGKWTDAVLHEATLGAFAWRSWSSEWNAGPGDHELTCRATDADGDVQPTKQPWNFQGMGNNLVQQISVTVR